MKLWIIVLSTATTLILSCNNCPDVITSGPDFLLNPKTDVFFAGFENDTIVYVDSLGNQYPFVKSVDMVEMFEQMDPLNPADCDNTGSFIPRFFRELRTIEYASLTEDATIKIETTPHIAFPIGNQSDIRQVGQTTTSRDYFSVFIRFGDCEGQPDIKVLQEADGTSRIVDAPWAFVKHGQRHEDQYFVARDLYWNELEWSHSKGLIAFNTCGRDWVQLAD